MHARSNAFQPSQSRREWAVRRIRKMSTLDAIEPKQPNAGEAKKTRALDDADDRRAGTRTAADEPLGAAERETLVMIDGRATARASMTMANPEGAERMWLDTTQ
jgi:hypothetical protein